MQEREEWGRMREGGGIGQDERKGEEWMYERKGRDGAG